MDIQEIIDLLEKAKESNNTVFRNLSGIKPYSSDVECTGSFINQTIDLLKQQPTASEFTKKMREKYKYAIDNKLCVSSVVYEESLARLDRAEPINKDLLEALERTLRFGLNPSLEKIVEAAIAKAKKGIKQDGLTPPP